MAKVMFTDNELLMMNDVTLMPAKYQIIKKVQNYFEEIYLNQHDQFHGVFDGFPTYKITKGENLNHQPYVVFDFPQMKKNQLNCHIRLMYWWGHGLFQFLYLSNLVHIEQTFEFIVKECSHYHIVTNDAIWEYISPQTIAIKDLSIEELFQIYQKNKMIRLDYKSNFDTLNQTNNSDYFNTLLNIFTINYGINKTI